MGDVLMEGYLNKGAHHQKRYFLLLSGKTDLYQFKTEEEYKSKEGYQAIYSLVGAKLDWWKETLNPQAINITLSKEKLKLKALSESDAECWRVAFEEAVPPSTADQAEQEEIEAATKLQALQRGKESRRRTQTAILKVHSVNRLSGRHKHDFVHSASASVHNGSKRMMKKFGLRKDSGLAEGDEEQEEEDGDDHEQHKAAAKIQALRKGQISRRKAAAMKESKDQERTRKARESAAAMAAKWAIPESDSDDDIDDPTPTIKMILVGDTAVGKTCFMQAFLHDEFNDSTNTTIAPDLGTAPLSLGTDKYYINLWDTCGQERFRSLNNIYFRDAIGVMLVYDVTRRETFRSIQEWMEIVEEQCRNPHVCMLIASKADLKNHQVLTEDGEHLAKEHNMLFAEISSKELRNIQESFQRLTAEIVKRGMLGDDDRNRDGEIDINTPFNDDKDQAGGCGC